MLETAVVIDAAGEPLYWHLPAGRSAAAIPDSGRLWAALWAHRDQLGGVAHTHPGGALAASWTDRTTFAACEDGLGRRLRWWVVTRQRLRCYRWRGPGRYHYDHVDIFNEPSWLAPLRVRSRLIEIEETLP